MIALIREILKNYWGYDSFRPMQENIILSVLEGNDSLALLPTGGGKSLCFQVPALAKEGICVVISPLIALMKDQVENLKKRGIRAEAIYSSLSKNEIECILNNAVYNDLKFLYVSPERLKTPIFIEHFKKMKLSLLAVDEAHCISQWGYDFRPPYLEIAQIRDCFPNVPVLALTATATTEVVEDIQTRLNFRKKNVFQKSFARSNLTYYVIKEEDKRGRMLRIIEKIKGSGVIYVRNRRKTQEIAEYLIRQGVSASFYHAGLSGNERHKRQNDWMKGTTQIMVSTNAFGMGIDKPNVRFVIHLDLPDSLEAYFQEAGRGGRDEKRAFAILLYHASDKLNLKEQYEKSYPSLDFIRRVYDTLGNYYRLPVGSMGDIIYSFSLKTFCEQYRIPLQECWQALLFLEKEALISLSELDKKSSKIHLLSSPQILYKFQVENVRYGPLLQTLLRSYGGYAFSDYISLNEAELGLRIGCPEEEIKKRLQELQEKNLIDYTPLDAGVQISFIQARFNARNLSLSAENYEIRKKIAKKKIEAVLYYAEAENRCRSQMLLSYFGEKNSELCGRCDYCIQKNLKILDAKNFEKIRKYILSCRKEGVKNLKDLLKTASPYSEEQLQKTWQYLQDNGFFD